MLAVDPSSPFTGGAILGDRVRMQRHATDPDVFIRSMATRGHLGGLSRSTPQAVRVLAAAGYGWILVETVGVGQVEVAVARRRRHHRRGRSTRAGATACRRPRPGLLEVGDVFVVNKADRAGLDATVRDLRSMLELSGARPWLPPIVETVATEDRGVDDLLGAVAPAPPAPERLGGARRTPRTAHSGRIPRTGA